MRTRVVLALVSVSFLIPLFVAAQQAGGRAAAPAQGQGRGGRAGGTGNVLGRGAPPLVPDNRSRAIFPTCASITPRCETLASRSSTGRAVRSASWPSSIST